MSTETKHTREPWGIADGYTTITVIVDSHDDYVMQLECTPENARRIVACVNACVGISDEQLEDDKLDVFLQALRIRELEAQNKELREAMRLILEITQDNDIIVLADKALVAGG